MDGRGVWRMMWLITSVYDKGVCNDGRGWEGRMLVIFLLDAEARQTPTAGRRRGRRVCGCYGDVWHLRTSGPHWKQRKKRGKKKEM